MIYRKTKTLIARIIRRKRFHFLTDRFFIKIFFGAQTQKAANEQFFVDYFASGKAFSKIPKVVNKRLVNTSCISVVYAQRLVGYTHSPKLSLVTKVAENYLECFSGFHYNEPWYNVIDARLGDRVLTKLPPRLRAILDSCLEGVELPRTGAHGDLSVNNVLFGCDTTDYKIIDWENFRVNGSYVEDVCRLLGTCVRKNLPVDDIKAIKITQVFGAKARLPIGEAAAIMIYILSQASCELESKKVEVVISNMSNRLEKYVHLS